MRYPALAMCIVLAASSTAMAGVDVTGTVEGSVKGIKGLEHVVVYVEDGPGEPRREERYEIDQKDKVFLPFVLPVPAGAEVVFLNSDPILHNVHSYRGKDTVFNWGMPLQGFELRKRFEEPGDVLLLCDVHHEMEAWIKVVPTGYFTQADDKGNFMLKAVPAGEYTVTAWHPRAKKTQSIKVHVPAEGVVKVDFRLKK